MRSESRVFRPGAGIGYGMVLIAVSAGLTACGDDEVASPMGEDEVAGVPAVLISRAVGVISSQETFANWNALSWQERSGRPGVNYEYDPESGTWIDESTGYSSVFVSNPQGSSEIRDESYQRWVVTLSREGIRQPDFDTADHMTVDFQLRRRRFAVNPEFTLEDPYRYDAQAQYEVDLVNGLLRIMTGAGTMTGTDRRDDLGAYESFAYQGTFGVQIDYTGDIDTCPGETLDAEIIVFDAEAQELDRYAGSFSVPPGGELFTGKLVSLRGPWSYGINRHQNCGD